MADLIHLLLAKEAILVEDRHHEMEVHAVVTLHVAHHAVDFLVEELHLHLELSTQSEVSRRTSLTKNFLLTKKQVLLK
jgi:hypothetical protein